MVEARRCAGEQTAGHQLSGVGKYEGELNERWESEGFATGYSDLGARVRFDWRTKEGLDEGVNRVKEDWLLKHIQ